MSLEGYLDDQYNQDLQVSGISAYETDCLS